MEVKDSYYLRVAIIEQIFFNEWVNDVKNYSVSFFKCFFIW